MLQVSVPIAYELLAQCIKQGQALVQRASLVGDFSDYESWKAARSQWIDPTVQALEHMYGGPPEAREFADAATCPEGSKRWQEQYGGDLKCVKEAIDFLTVLQGELAFEDGSKPSSAAELVAGGASLVAGGDDLSTDRDEPRVVPQIHADLARDVVELQERDVEARQERASEHAPTSKRESFAERAREPDSERTGEPEDERTPVDEREPVDAQLEREPDDEREPVDAQPLTPPRSEDTPEETGSRPRQPPIGAELAHAQQVGSQLAQHPQPSPPAEREPHEAPATARTRDVYLAHGRDEKWKQAVEHLLEQAGEHEIKIVNRRTNERTRLTEELREDAPGSHYAVVLLTADDVGGARLESDTEPYFSTRAHQEVVFEMGFLVAALSPGRVCVLYEDGVEMPCDLDGVSHVRLDLAGTWQPKLLLHLRRAGFDYDMNKLAAA
jgi:predicted nucleotide-binding protein